MKHSAKYLSGIVFGFLLVLSAVPGHADTKKVKVTIPFDFVVGSKQLKAGNYVVQSWGNSGDGALLFRSEAGDAQQVVFVVPVENNTGNHERLIFHRYGDEQFVAQVWFMGDEEGYELIPGTREKESAANRAVGAQMGARQ